MEVKELGGIMREGREMEGTRMEGEGKAICFFADLLSLHILLHF